MVRTLALTVALLLSIGCAETVETPPLPVQVGIHPDAAAQPTERGRILATLVAWKGRLYPGYGDFGDNTGPIAVSPFDPSTGRFESVWVSDTEAIYTYRRIGDRLFAPAIDRRVSADYAFGEPWTDRAAVNSTHVFDMATLTGQDLWMVGSQDADAVAWRSLDGGRSWTEALRLAPVTPGGGRRFWFVGIYNGRLYLEAFPWSPQPHSNVFDGTSWSDGPDLLDGHDGWGWHPEVFAGRMVLATGYAVDADGSDLLAFDGVRIERLLNTRVFDFTVAEGRLAAIGVDRSVWLTSDLARWTQLPPAPAGSRSIGILDGRIYLGASDGRLFTYR